MWNWLTWMTIDEPSVGAGALLLAHLVAAIGAGTHVLLTKESPRAAAGWLALVWLSPLVGAATYTLLGVNRVRRKAVRLRGDDEGPLGPGPEDTIDLARDPRFASLAPLQRALDGVVETPLVPGNRVVPLHNGEEAFPAMIAAIDEAQRSVAFLTFLFEADAWGERFVDALARAVDRGVEVKLLIDGVGIYFSWPQVTRMLRRRGVPFERFLWSWNPLRMTLLNLRNHRKILVIDGRVAFTGGINPRGTFVQEGDGERTAHRDLHARVEGPVVRSLMETFARDWVFETDERLEGEAWFPELDAAGAMPARVIPDGPDADLDKATFTFLQALGAARHHVRILTPYFLPEESLQWALMAAAQRGVTVDVLVPWRSNHPGVDWAMRADLPLLLDRGVRVWGQPAPFDHGKLMLVDDLWCCLGSANWDPRSLRLNFELLVEVYDHDLVRDLAAAFDTRRDGSRRFDADHLRSRPTWKRLRDGTARLFRPYL